MDDTPATHIAWARTCLPRFRFSLADSAIAPPDLEPFGLPPLDALPAEGDDLLDVLEHVLGERYGAPGHRVQLAAGASEANAAVFGALTAPGDEVLIETPGYEPHLLTAERFGAQVRRFRRPLPCGAGTLAAAVDAACTPATRMVVLTHPHNPSGDTLDAAELAALDDVAARRGLWLVCDETFRDAAVSQALGTVAARGPHWVATNSLTKSYGLGGLRLGWIAADAAVLKRCRAMQDLLSAQPALPSLALARALLPHLDTLRARTHRILSANQARWAALVSGWTSPRIPAASRATTAWCVFDSPGSGDALAAFAAERFELGLVPGRYFGDASGVRVTLGTEPEIFRRALDVFERVLAAFAAPSPPAPTGPTAASPRSETR